ncbi:RHS repeat domain-containing protein [Shewanella xiamenensis]|nr:RHS repeat-associated core domain-containing protein [Shewanella xiamenensis]
MDYRLTDIDTSGKQDLHFEYDVANNIDSITNGQNTSYSQTLGYDDAYRLESVTSSADNQFMTYDDVGNRKTHSVNNLNHSYQYSSISNRLNQYLPNGVAKSIGHDANGNIISDSSRGNTYTYDAFEQLIKLTKNGVDTRYGYNAIGQRAYKANGSSTERYVYSTAGLLLAEPNSAQEYIYYGGQPVGYVKSNQLYYVHNDQLGRPELLTNTSQAVVWKANLKAFDRTVLTSSISEFNIGFPGQYFDMESSLYYNMFRYYDPQLGRYIQSDPIGLAGGSNTYTYTYAENNSIALTDPTGLFVPGFHNRWTNEAMGMLGCSCGSLGSDVAGVDFRPGSQMPENSYTHHMRDGKVDQPIQDATELYNELISKGLTSCNKDDLAAGIHALQDSFSPAHRDMQPWNGMNYLNPAVWAHGVQDSVASITTSNAVRAATASYIKSSAWFKLGGCGC